MTEEWITTEEAAELTEYDPEHIRRLVRSKKVRAKKFGPVWQIDKASLLEYFRLSQESPDKRYGPK